MAKWSTTVECRGPLDVNISVSGQVILDLSKLKAVIPCAPAKIGGGFKIGGSEKTYIRGKASVQADLKEKLLQGDVAGLLGAGVGGTIHSGGFVLCDEKVVGADGEIHGIAMVLGKTVCKGHAGVEDCKGIFKADIMLERADESSGSGTLCLATDSDALAYVEEYGTFSALNK